MQCKRADVSLPVTPVTGGLGPPADDALLAAVTAYAEKYGLDSNWIAQHGLPRAKTARDMARRSGYRNAWRAGWMTC
jgi:molybdopterin-biosynthesis enzyme MoeA-like protein